MAEVEKQDGYAVLITERALQLGYESAKDKQMEAILAVVRGKEKYPYQLDFKESMI